MAALAGGDTHLASQGPLWRTRLMRFFIEHAHCQQLRAERTGRSPPGAAARKEGVSSEPRVGSIRGGRLRHNNNNNKTTTAMARGIWRAVMVWTFLQRRLCAGVQDVLANRSRAAP